ncbi:PadR family transcriptional regulator [Candidatus Soleaferrea massiliensis]|uniref:PadR family transcriptional regulator n=1 Tax=Candidatus Soleaferrea massiliensis TaxID=1470354 RepID=UPI00058F4E82|nr:PadR family transcriptional regulator [Candidatus Soleaferrea massiliensis]
MNTQFRKGVIEMCVLALISRQDMYGYEIVQNIASYTDINEGTVYPILRRLTKEEYVVTYLKESTIGPARKYYHITERGQGYLGSLKEDWKAFSMMVNDILNGEHEEKGRAE